MIDTLKMIAGSPLPIPSLGLEIHQPTIREVALLGEKELFQVYSLLTMTKEKYLEVITKKTNNDPEIVMSVKNSLMFMDDFQVILETAMQDSGLYANFVGFFYIIFPKARKITATERFLMISWQKETGREETIISGKEFSEMVPVFTKMFETEGSQKEDFNPVNEQAAEIAAKIQARRKRLAREKGTDGEEKSALSTAISVLATADGLSLDTILNYTIPQVYYQLERTKKYNEYQSQITLGAFGGLKDIEIADWMHSI